MGKKSRRNRPSIQKAPVGPAFASSCALCEMEDTNNTDVFCACVQCGKAYCAHHLMGSLKVNVCGVEHRSDFTACFKCAFCNMSQSVETFADFAQGRDSSIKFLMAKTNKESVILRSSCPDCNRDAATHLRLVNCGEPGCVGCAESCIMVSYRNC